jgi:ectoine hydroxylase-related dioxygenase (phytanoyl-CoA dioxygenase family)
MTTVFSDTSNQATFETEGVIQVPFLSNAEVAALTEIYQTQFGGASDRAFHSTMFVNNALYRKRADEAIRAVIQTKLKKLLVGQRLLFANFIVKESSSDTAVGIHQDWNFTTPECRSLNVWIPLVDINETTGLFYALRGSHRSFENIRYTPYPPDLYQPISDYVTSHATAYQPKAGEAIVYDGAVVHFSSPNTSGRIRIAIGMALIPEGAPCVHYYRRDMTSTVLDVYETNEAFYQRFNFFDEPKGVAKIGELSAYKQLPSVEDLVKSRP